MLSSFCSAGSLAFTTSQGCFKGKGIKPQQEMRCQCLASLHYFRYLDSRVGGGFQDVNLYIMRRAIMNQRIPKRIAFICFDVFSVKRSVTVFSLLFLIFILCGDSSCSRSPVSSSGILCCSCRGGSWGFSCFFFFFRVLWWGIDPSWGLYLPRNTLPVSSGWRLETLRR